MNYLMTPTARKWSMALFFLLGATILFKGYEQFVPFGVRYVWTPSIPKGLYASTWLDHRPLQRGEGVCFRGAPTGWFADRKYFREGASICKYVLGVPGDEVRPQGDRVQICHDGKCSDVGQVLTADLAGRPTQGAFSAATVIPVGHYYLGSTYFPRSFDSRYMGLIEAGRITVRISPLWTYK
jgi:conjugative transfer signal peptidase TraF